MAHNPDLAKYRPNVKLADMFKLITEHTGLALFLVYAMIATAGFIYLVTFYSHFDLEVTVYLEIGDILVAGIKDPMVMLMVAGSFSVVLIMLGLTYIQAPFSAYLDKKFDKGPLRFIPSVFGVKNIKTFWWNSLLILVLYFVLFIAVHSKIKAEGIIEEKQGLILVDSKITAGNDDEYSLLGTSINYVFLYNHNTKHTLILPLNSINSLKSINPLKTQSAETPVKSE